MQEGSFTAAIYTVTEGTHHAAIHRWIIEDPPADAAQNIQGDVVPPCVRGGSLLCEAASNLFWESIQTVSTTCFENLVNLGEICEPGAEGAPNNLLIVFVFRLGSGYKTGVCKKRHLSGCRLPKTESLTFFLR